MDDQLFVNIIQPLTNLSDDNRHIALVHAMLKPKFL